MLSSLVAQLADVRRLVVLQVAAIDREIRRLIQSETNLKRLMTVAFLSAIDDVGRFNHARDVGPYLGLTPTRYQSGETDRQGRISKCGDAFTRTCLYEAAHVLLAKVQRFSPLKAWGWSNTKGQMS
jgi:transposase